MTALETDYLVVGAGAMGMAFTDALMTETDASVALVDRYHQPGGHWTVAYPHVRLHQPSAFYGVNSKQLGSNVIDATGWNEGLYELATSSEVCAYFDQVMQQQFLPSGRVHYFPMTEHRGDGQLQSRVSGTQTTVHAAKIVDATYMNVTVPSMRDPAYEVRDGVACVAPNGLSRVAGEYQRYVVIGAGKTGMDACLFLLGNGVPADRIGWVMPRDSWLLNRALIQPGGEFSNDVALGFARQLEAIAGANSVEDVLENVAATGNLLRFDPDVWPTMYRCATVTEKELEALRSIDNVIRLGRVQRIEPSRIVLDGGEVATDAATLHVDCSADGLERRPAVPVFRDSTITLQAVRTCQQVFSAALIGHVEAAYSDPQSKNELCVPVPHPDSEVDFLRTALQTNLNAARWAQDSDLQAWLRGARLDGFSARVGDDAPSPEALAEVGALVMKYAMPATAKLAELLAELDGD